MTTIETRTYSAEEMDLHGFVLMNVLNFAVKPANTKKEMKARYDARRFFGACKSISKAITILESDSMTAQDVDCKLEAKAVFKKKIWRFTVHMRCHTGFRAADVRTSMCWKIFFISLPVRIFRKWAT